MSLSLSAIEPSSVPLNRLHHIGRDVYEGMIEHGLLPNDRRVALVDGLLVATDSEQLHPISLDVYKAMVKHGLLTKYDKIELLDGLMVEKMTKGDPHETAIVLLRDALLALGFAGWHLRTEAAVALADGPAGRPSMPEPDLLCIRGGARDYAARKPTPADLAFIAEVADSSLRKDRNRLARYAWSKVPVVWIVNLFDRCVEVYSEPSGPAGDAKYNVETVYGPEGRVPVVIDDQEVGQIAVKEILP